MQIHRAGDQVTVYTRSLDDVTARLPEVVEATLALPVRELIADGEAIALRPDGRPQPFQVTASRFGRSVDVAAARTAQPLSVFFFDILHRDGIDLLDAPTSERAAALDEIVPAQNRVDRLITSDPAAAGDFLDTTLAAGHEGVMAKSLTAPYEAGRRGAGWLKVKPVHTLDLVVLAVEWGSGRRKGKLSNIHLGALDPAEWRLRDVGQDVQGYDRRDAGVADRRGFRSWRQAAPTATSCNCGRSRWSRWRSTVCRALRVTPAAWRCGSPGCCVTATTNAPRKPTPSTPCAPCTGVKLPAAQFRVVTRQEAPWQHRRSRRPIPNT